MGRCIYCGENAGLLRSVHLTCLEKHEAGWQQMVSVATQAAMGASGDLEGLTSDLEKLAKSNYVPTSNISAALVEAWEKAVIEALKDDGLSEDEETHLTEYREHFSLSQADLDARGAYTQMVKAGVIREILEGKVPSRVNIQGVIPFNLQKSESLVWLFQHVPLYEVRVRRERTGSFGGATVRVMKGVYFHTGRFGSHAVEKSATEHVDTGLLGITNKHIYFAGPLRKFRIPYAKIVSFEPYSDGIGVMRDAASAKPQTFVTEDGWFTYNLVFNLSQMQA